MYLSASLENANKIFEFLYLRDLTKPTADIIIGFGHFDMRIPRLCGKLHREGYCEKILFTGGRGAGTADLKDAEGVEFERELRRIYPDLPAKNIIVESESANTAENILLSESILKSSNPDFCFSKGISKAIAVTCPYRQKRVFLCMEKLFPHIAVFNRPPDTTFEFELELYQSKNEDFVLLLMGEIERIKTYPDRGFIAPAMIPEVVDLAYRELQGTNRM